MSFWTRPLPRLGCDHESCTKPAQLAIISPINELVGHYCGPHAAQELKRLNADPALEQSLRRAADEAYYGRHPGARGMLRARE